MSVFRSMSLIGLGLAMVSALVFFKSPTAVECSVSGSSDTYRQPQWPAQFTGGFGGGGGLGNDEEEKRPEPQPDRDPERTRLIRQILERRIPLHFERGLTTLPMIVETIRDQTTCDEYPNGIPVYVDPIHYVELGYSPEDSSVFEIDLEGVRLEVSLELLLRQVGAGFVVRDGVLIIDDQEDPRLVPSIMPEDANDDEHDRDDNADPMLGFNHTSNDETGPGIPRRSGGRLS